MSAESNPLNGIRRVLAAIENERWRQIAVEGFHPLNDDRHAHGQLSAAASCYAKIASLVEGAEECKRNGDMHVPHVTRGCPPFWPWTPQWWKPKTPRQNLVRAAALIVAEIERIDRRDGRAEPVAVDAQRDRLEVLHVDGTTETLEYDGQAFRDLSGRPRATIERDDLQPKAGERYQARRLWQDGVPVGGTLNPERHQQRPPAPEFFVPASASPYASGPVSDPPAESSPPCDTSSSTDGGSCGGGE